MDFPRRDFLKKTGLLTGGLLLHHELLDAFAAPAAGKNVAASIAPIRPSVNGSGIRRRSPAKREREAAGMRLAPGGWSNAAF